MVNSAMSVPNQVIETAKLNGFKLTKIENININTPFQNDSGEDNFSEFADFDITLDGKTININSTINSFVSNANKFLIFPLKAELYLYNDLSCIDCLNLLVETNAEEAKLKVLAIENKNQWWIAAKLFNLKKVGDVAGLQLKAVRAFLEDCGYDKSQIAKDVILQDDFEINVNMRNFLKLIQPKLFIYEIGVVVILIQKTV